MDHSDAFKFYLSANPDGYPPEWSRLPGETFGIKHLVRADAGNRCVRCAHPYEVGTPLNDGWSRCDPHCTHDGPIRWYEYAVEEEDDPNWKYLDTIGGAPAGGGIIDRGPSGEAIERYAVEARWRILTVHHLNGVKLDCRWWNLAALCQVCHLVIQGRVFMEQTYVFEHSEWFKPHAAGFYAHKYLNEDLTREQTMERLDELLALERLV